MTTVSVIGAGAFGTALAQLYTLAGHHTVLWAREADFATALAAERENKKYLPGHTLDDRLHITNDLARAMQSDIILCAIPSQHMRGILQQMQPYAQAGQSVVLCSKGIETATGQMLSDIVRDECPQVECALLTGPNFAHELMSGKPSAATLACASPVQGDLLATKLSNASLRLYTTTDMIGAQTGGAVKNVIAIACGIIEGLGLGESARAGLVTRGLAEIARLTVALGGKRETLMGQCGVGDLMLTCASAQSRNFSLGLQLGQGRKLADILAERTSVTEGVATAKATADLSRKIGVDMPIVKTVCACLYDDLDPRQAFNALMNRPVRAEHE